MSKRHHFTVMLRAQPRREELAPGLVLLMQHRLTEDLGCQNRVKVWSQLSVTTLPTRVLKGETTREVPRTKSRSQQEKSSVWWLQNFPGNDSPEHLYSKLSPPLEQIYQPTKEYNVRSHNALALFTLGHLVVGFRAKDLSLQPPAFGRNCQVSVQEEEHFETTNT